MNRTCARGLGNRLCFACRGDWFAVHAFQLGVRAGEGVDAVVVLAVREGG
jgi:hypothetical protein